MLLLVTVGLQCLRQFTNHQARGLGASRLGCERQRDVEEWRHESSHSGFPLNCLQSDVPSNQQHSPLSTFNEPAVAALPPRHGEMIRPESGTDFAND